MLPYNPNAFMFMGPQNTDQNAKILSPPRAPNQRGRTQPRLAGNYCHLGLGYSGRTAQFFGKNQTEGPHLFDF